MPAWTQRSRLTTSTLNRALAERSSHQQVGGHDGLDYWLQVKAKRYVFDSDARECFFCGAKAGAMTTGVLPVVGSIWKCRNCEANYKSAKEE